MPADQERDWIDEALARAPMWEPPSGFAERVAMLATTSGMFAPVPTFGPRVFIASLASRAVNYVIATVEGSVWVARQYRDLLFGS